VSPTETFKFQDSESESLPGPACCQPEGRTAHRASGTVTVAAATVTVTFHMITGSGPLSTFGQKPRTVVRLRRPARRRPALNRNPGRLDGHSESQPGPVPGLRVTARTRSPRHQSPAATVTMTNWSCGQWPLSIMLASESLATRRRPGTQARRRSPLVP
jgi:hypothetical protein